MAIETDFSFAGEQILAWNVPAQCPIGLRTQEKQALFVVGAVGTDSAPFGESLANGRI
ncbi:MAG TPA: hypothetical protein VHX60_17675 [Acidobacteriaceae bacterium]|nr:hypothetical protein [Acidobacteriaceae bacterium]